MATLTELTQECNDLKQKILDQSKNTKDSNLVETSRQASIANDLAGKRLKCKRILKGHFDKVYSVAWCKGNGQLCSASQDGKLFIWDPINNIKEIAVPLESNWVMNCSYSDTGNFVASGGLDNKCTIHNISDKKNVKTIELGSHTGFLSGAQFIDDTKIITSSGDGSCLLWDIEKQAILNRFEGHDGSIESLALCDDKKTFLTGGIDATSKMWDVNSCNYIREYKGHESDINEVYIFPNGNAFGTASDEGKSCLFDFRLNYELAKYQYPGGAPLISADFSKSGRLLFCGSYRGQIFATDILTGQCTFNVQHDDTSVTCLSVDPEGHVLASSGWSEVIKLWKS